MTPVPGRQWTRVKVTEGDEERDHIAAHDENEGFLPHLAGDEGLGTQKIRNESWDGER
jgi:hypothetical protein